MNFRDAGRLETREVPCSGIEPGSPASSRIFLQTRLVATSTKGHESRSRPTRRLAAKK